MKQWHKILICTILFYVMMFSVVFLAFFYLEFDDVILLYITALFVGIVSTTLFLISLKSMSLVSKTHLFSTITTTGSSLIMIGYYPPVTIIILPLVTLMFLYIRKQDKLGRLENKAQNLAAKKPEKKNILLMMLGLTSITLAVIATAVNILFGWLYSSPLYIIAVVIYIPCFKKMRLLANEK